MGLAGRAQGARRRRCGDIVDDEQRRDRPATPMRPKGSSGAWTSAALALLDNAITLPASRRLASAHAALGTRHILILGQAPSLGQISWGLRSNPRFRRNWTGIRNRQRSFTRLLPKTPVCSSNTTILSVGLSSFWGIVIENGIPVLMIWSYVLLFNDPSIVLQSEPSILCFESK